MRPRLSKKDLTRQAASPVYTPTRGPRPPHHRTKLTRIRPLVYLADNETLSQSLHLPPLPGQVAFAGDRPQDGHARVAPVPDVFGASADPFLLADDDIFGPIFVAFDREDLPQRQKRQQKKARQWQRWISEVIPQLIAPYLRLLCETKSLRDPPTPVPGPVCQCGENGKHLEVAVVRFAGE